MDALKELHRLEIEKITLEHKHKLELLDQETQNSVTTDAISKLFGIALDSPAIKEQVNVATKNVFTKRKKK